MKRDLPLLVLEAEMPSGTSPRPRVSEFNEFLSPLGYRGLAFDFDGELKVAPMGGIVAGHANVAFVPELRAEFQSLRSAIG